jgi:HEAT repeats
VSRLARIKAVLPGAGGSRFPTLEVAVGIHVGSRLGPRPGNNLRSCSCNTFRQARSGSSKVKKRRQYVVLVLIGGVAIAVVLAHARRPQEPMYQGKPLSYWFDQVRQPGLEPAQTAIRQIGPKSVPFLLGQVRDQDASLRRVHRAIWLKTPTVLQRLIPKPTPVDRSLGVRIKWALRPLGSTVIPELAAALHDHSLAVRFVAIDVLGSMEAYADAALPVLGQALKDPYAEIRFKAVVALAQIGRNAKQAVPVLVDALNDNDKGPDGGIIYVREKAANILSRMGSDAQIAIPGLKRLMQETDSYTRQQAAIASWLIGHDTNLVSSAIAELENAPDVETYGRFLSVLGTIGPEAKAAVPVILRTAGKWSGLPRPESTELARSIPVAVAILESRQPGFRSPGQH